MGLWISLTWVNNDVIKWVKKQNKVTFLQHALPPSLLHLPSLLQIHIIIIIIIIIIITNKYVKSIWKYK